MDGFFCSSGVPGGQARGVSVFGASWFTSPSASGELISRWERSTSTAQQREDGIRSMWDSQNAGVIASPAVEEMPRRSGRTCASDSDTHREAPETWPVPEPRRRAHRRRSSVPGTRHIPRWVFSSKLATSRRALDDLLGHGKWRRPAAMAIAAADVPELCGDRDVDTAGWHPDNLPVLPTLSGMVSADSPRLSKPARPAAAWFRRWLSSGRRSTWCARARAFLGRARDRRLRRDLWSRRGARGTRSSTACAAS